MTDTNPPADGCTCTMNPSSEWGIYAGLSEPGDVCDWSPDCPVHKKED
jgi:hypothetical protein